MRKSNMRFRSPVPPLSLPLSGAEANAAQVEGRPVKTDRPATPRSARALWQLLNPLISDVFTPVPKQVPPASPRGRRALAATVPQEQAPSLETKINTVLKTLVSSKDIDLLAGALESPLEGEDGETAGTEAALARTADELKNCLVGVELQTLLTLRERLSWARRNFVLDSAKHRLIAQIAAALASVREELPGFKEFKKALCGAQEVVRCAAETGTEVEKTAAIRECVAVLCETALRLANGLGGSTDEGKRPKSFKQVTILALDELNGDSDSVPSAVAKQLCTMLRLSAAIVGILVETATISLVRKDAGCEPSEEMRKMMATTTGLRIVEQAIADVLFENEDFKRAVIVESGKGAAPLFGPGLRSALEACLGVATVEPPEIMRLLRSDRRDRFLLFLKDRHVNEIIRFLDDYDAFRRGPNLEKDPQGALKAALVLVKKFGLGESQSEDFGSIPQRKGSKREDEVRSPINVPSKTAKEIKALSELENPVEQLAGLRKALNFVYGHVCKMMMLHVCDFNTPISPAPHAAAAVKAMHEL